MDLYVYQAGSAQQAAEWMKVSCNPGPRQHGQCQAWTQRRCVHGYRLLTWRACRRGPRRAKGRHTQWRSRRGRSTRRSRSRTKGRGMATCPPPGHTQLVRHLLNQTDPRAAVASWRLTCCILALSRRDTDSRAQGVRGQGIGYEDTRAYHPGGSPQPSCLPSITWLV